MSLLTLLPHTPSFSPLSGGKLRVAKGSMGLNGATFKLI